MKVRQRIPAKKEPRKMTLADLRRLKAPDREDDETPEQPVYNKKNVRSEGNSSIDQDPRIRPFGLCLNPNCEEGVGKTRRDVGTKPYGVFDGWRAVCCRECNTTVTAMSIRKRLSIDQKNEEREG